VDHALLRLVLAYFFYVFHQFFYWVMARALLGQQQLVFEWGKTLAVAALNAVVAVALFRLLDRLRQTG
jgi:rod shape-determining protein MreD